MPNTCPELNTNVKGPTAAKWYNKCQGTARQAEHKKRVSGYLGKNNVANSRNCAVLCCALRHCEVPFQAILSLPCPHICLICISLPSTILGLPVCPGLPLLQEVSVLSSRMAVVIWEQLVCLTSVGVPLSLSRLKPTKMIRTNWKCGADLRGSKRQLVP